LFEKSAACFQVGAFFVAFVGRSGALCEQVTIGHGGGIIIDLQLFKVERYHLGMDAVFGIRWKCYRKPSY
jgi:hypothetical protein